MPAEPTYIVVPAQCPSCDYSMAVSVAKARVNAQVHHACENCEIEWRVTIIAPVEGGEKRHRVIEIVRA